MSRVREKTDSAIIGSAKVAGTTNVTTQIPGYDSCTDLVAPGNGHPLTIVHYHYKGGLANGGINASKGPYTNYALEGARSKNAQFSVATDAQLGLAPYSTYATKLLASTNPSRPDVDIPVFIAELKDLPSLVYKAGGNLLQKIAKYNLQYQFAIRPLVSDLSAMLNWVSLVESRKKELEALGKTGLRRKRTLARASLTVDDTVNMNSQSGFSQLNRPRRRITTCELWGYVEWLPAAGFPKTSADLLSAARRAVLGLTIDGATAWELIPFSWLADWYFSVGDYLQSTRNIVPVTHSTPLIMTRKEYEVQVNLAPITGLAITAFHGKGTTKTRTSVSSSPITARMPCLTARQLSILASLFILQHGKY